MTAFDFSGQPSVFRFPPLLEVVFVIIFSGKIGSVIDNGRALALEKFVQFQIGLCVNGVSQTLGKKTTNHWLLVNLDTLFFKVSVISPKEVCGSAYI